MGQIQPLLQLLLAAASSWLLLAGLIPLLQRRLLDTPNARSSHSQPTPRGGGVAFVIVACIAWVVIGSWTLLLCLPLALVGLLDDSCGLPVGLRYGAQFATAGLLLQHASLPGAASFWWWVLPLLIAATAVINFTNFMDGLDGLVASCMVVLLTTAALGSSPDLWPLVGALLGFLYWNWSPAKVFMGDAGSTFLGAVFVTALFCCPSWDQALGLLLVATPILADATSCVIRRCLAGQSLLRAHRLHLYQRLQQAGWSHRRVTIVYSMATAALALLHQLGGWSLAMFGAMIVIFVGLRLEKSVARSFAEAAWGSSRSPVKTQRSTNPPC